MVTPPRPLRPNEPRGVPRVVDRPLRNGIFWVLRSCHPFAVSDLLRWRRFRDVSELRCKEIKSVTTSARKIDIVAFRVKHWRARKRRDTYRGYNG